MVLAQAKEQIVAGPEALNGEPYASRRTDFLARHGLNNVTLEPLPAHASYRRYYRVHGGGRSMLVMDATLDVTEPLMWFVTVDQHLRNLGLTAPEIYEYETAETHELALLEDFGDDTYDVLIDRGADPMPFYEKAIDVLAYLHNHAAAAKADVSAYTVERMLNEAENTINWYAPAARGSAVSDDARAAYRAIWKEILEAMPPVQDSLVLYDYIFNNMMHVPGRSGLNDCGLLDFQAARIGPAVYDVVSLLEDIRRDLAPEAFQVLRRRYLDQVQITDSEEAFDLWFSVMTTQRHCKNFGNLVRLFVRDGKPQLLKYIPRMRNFAWQHLQKPELAGLKNWFAENGIDLTQDLKEGFEHADGYPKR